MFKQNYEIILASASPRRQQYLHQLGLTFSVSPAEVDETPHGGETPEGLVRRVAKLKNEKIAQQSPTCCIISADTIVCLGTNVFGKPKDTPEAFEFLKLLRGKTHKVITCVCLSILSIDYRQTLSVETRVTFNSLSDDILMRYVNTSDPLDKAGAYGIQSFGGFLIKSIDGSYSNVVGLPVSQLVHTLLKDKILS